MQLQPAPGRSELLSMRCHSCKGAALIRCTLGAYMSVPVTSAADRDAVKLFPANALGRQLGLVQAAVG